MELVTTKPLVNRKRVYFLTKFRIIGIMPHCIDNGTIEKITIKTFNGQSWEESMEQFPQIKEFSKASGH